MHVVYKYACPAAPSFVLHLPQDAEVLALGWQGGAVLWARVNTDNAIVAREFLLLSTGYAYDKLKKLSTVHLSTMQTQLNGAPFVLHLFEVL